MDFKNIHESKAVRMTLAVVGTLFIAVLIFKVGVFVGYKKASYSFELGDNYYRTFRGGRPADASDLPGGHGAAGTIIHSQYPFITIADDDNVEKTVMVSSSTMVRRANEVLTVADIRTGEFAVVLGSPNQGGVIEAKFIRLMPLPPDEASTTLQ